MEIQDIQSASVKQNTNLSQPAGNKLSKKDFDSVAICLHTLSLAKNIKLMQGTLTVWEKLILEDIYSGNFEIDDFIKGVKKCIRLPMYNRIDYADIYSESVAIYKKRKSEEKNFIESQKRRVDSIQPKKKIPETIRDILKSKKW